MSSPSSKKARSKPTTSKYKTGDRVLLKIGNRPIMAVTVLASDLTQKTPRYTINWAEHGFNEILNTVHIPEASFLGLA
jgi:hypothetical protein